MKFSSTFSLLAIGLALVLPGSSWAVVVHFSDQDIAIPDTFAGVSVDLESGANSTSLSGISGGDANFFFGGEGISNDADAGALTATWQPIRTGTGNTDQIQNLSFGTTIDASTSFYSTGFGSSSTHIGAGGTQFTSGTSGYLGFSLIIDDPGNPGSDLTVYGWARVTLYNDGTAGTLHEWAFDDTGAAIDIGDIGVVPEPAAAMLILLAGGFTALRRRPRR